MEHHGYGDAAGVSMLCGIMGLISKGLASTLRRSGIARRLLVLVTLTACLASAEAQDFGLYGKWVRSPQLGAEDFLSNVITDIEKDDDYLKEGSVYENLSDNMWNQHH